jgi:hypothetical protein
MKANELRLQNIVEDIFDLRNPKIRRIDIEDFVMIRNYGFHPIPFKPITLTEEWLLKAGFGYFGDGNEYFKHISVEYIELLDQGVDFKIFIFDYPCLNIKYVHQLQNLYFSFTNEELKIIL